jgi:hypothetical protein
VRGSLRRGGREGHRAGGRNRDPGFGRRGGGVH